MTDHVKTQEYLAESDMQCYGNRLAVALVLIALVVPNLVTLMIG